MRQPRRSSLARAKLVEGFARAAITLRASMLSYAETFALSAEIINDSRDRVEWVSLALQAGSAGAWAAAAGENWLNYFP
ncbi:hypothetical protein CRV173 [Nile crocodilepox virus]|uniref:Uncharacterized protein n=1 Tax=Nile crocodilepox virus (isolate Crocodylus niloticus/Zimbabwe/Ume/2001) TaxID=1289473 RepID=Q06ZX8_CPRVZ|nr:hypothetical protein CRV001 [Nile crocodilepox virus]YP_784363.1 hypothetical protein CRV173 [Nile crocodilepox virus]ABJ08892.1 hypothetical protein CRV001 [Nile crocodilepox virus]ABJ09064.1 hypothetical protein CRV173 [Nile crocodilepox virus]